MTPIKIINSNGTLAGTFRFTPFSSEQLVKEKRKKRKEKLDKLNKIMNNIK